MAAVDLTVQDSYILEHLGNADPSDYIIHYFNNLTAAQNGAPRITNAAGYTAQDGEVIYVRIEDVATGCYSIESFTIHINIPLALTRPPVLSVCNEALPNDMTTEFDLTVMENTILGPFGVGLGYTVNYYEPGATTPIADPTAYVNTSNPMTLTVEVITLAGCKSYTTMTIKVLPLPTPNTTPDALVLCDDNNAGDGQEEFDLTQAAGDIMDNEPNLILSYHLTYEDADQDINAIADPTQFVSGTATIYVRVEANTGNPNDAVCYQIVELELIVNPLPALGENGAIPAYAICEQNTDGFATFILSSHIPEILGEDADPNDYLVRFYFDQAALDAGTALPNQYNNISTPQDILVWVQHIESGCTTTAPMQLLVEEAAVANAPADPSLSTCDDDGTNDGMHAFDLSVFDAEILGAQDPADYSVAYYESFEDADNATNPIADPTVYVNTTADVMTIYARVTNTSTISGCHDITEITLIVERLPEPVITSVDGSDTICVDYTTDDVLRTVTLDSGIPSGMGYSFVWYLDGVELTDYDPASPTYEAIAEGNYTVEVTGPAPLNCISDISAAFQVQKSGPASPVGVGYEVTNYFSDNQVITVFVEGYGEYEYKLDEDGMWQSSNVFTDVPAGTHTVYVRDVSTEFACDEIAIEGVSLVDYPHYFTPNGDGYHDTWNIIGLNQPDAKVYIFDRYGKLIKQISATEESEGWDGTFNGTPLPATDYWFTVTYRETVNGMPVVKEFKAHFSLKR
ncbi:T9SS type B sorting domain-containing protein [Flavobacterium alkalisoli]|uniref:T9SS type B sorting domain-containing protein n=2 Tax=Flavobacterium alkalisoli TaxID=2602769 RepID=A0A5B9FU47_9FLAO|nr:T9SS type B sorting domain-containing protein [Flavobacterium alkalisoli]QEE49769.1 T9SS type B sorting domain-containing protein [Flavobacterium alkalisoli]